MPEEGYHVVLPDKFLWAKADNSGKSPKIEITLFKMKLEMY